MIAPAATVPAAAAAALDPATLVRALLDGGYGPVTGVPCSYLGPVISCLADRHPEAYLVVANEGEAVAIGAGARLAGRHPVVILQNSGLGNTVNPLTSLCHTLRLPVLLLVTWRGEPGRPDEPQHEVMGRITAELLTAMDIRHEMLPVDDADIAERLAVARRYMDDTGLPFAFIVRKGTIAAYPSSGPEQSAGTMRRDTAIGHVMRRLPADALVIATTGKTARELERDFDRPENLYVVGSMGCASSVGLGVALHAPDRQVVIIDGDGAALMRMEAIATIGRHAPANLLHLVLDNEAYESTGGQPTGSAHTDLAGVAAACAYRATADVSDAEGLGAAVDQALAERGPWFVRVRIAPGSDPNLGRPALRPPDSARRFRKAIIG